MTPLRPPSSDEALVGQQRVAVEQLTEVIEKNELSDYSQLAAELLEKFDANDLVAAAIKSLTKEPDGTPVSITEERPLPMRRGSSQNRGGYKGNRSGGGRSFGGSRSGGSRRSGGRDGSRRDGNRSRSNKYDR